MQSTPNRVFFSLTCLDLIDAKVSIGLSPEFSAKAIGIASRASANALIAYCSSPGLYTIISDALRILGCTIRTLTAASSTASEQAISAAPPPYTTRLSFTKFRTTQRASCNDRLASSMIYLRSPVSHDPMAQNTWLMYTERFVLQVAEEDRRR